MSYEHIIFIPETFSTNNLLNSIVQEDLFQNRKTEEFHTIYTDFQTNGRGMAQNTWHSISGENILASSYFTPMLLPKKQFFFNIFFSLSIREVLSKYLHDVKIKWPNDLYVKNKKIVGILIEHTIQGERIIQTIAGFGININQTEFPEYIPHPTSFKLETGRTFDRLTIIKEIIDAFQHYYDLLHNKKFDYLQEEYYRHLYHINEFHTYIIGTQEVEAKITGVDEYGRLLLKGRNGEMYCCGFKEVRYTHG